MLAEASREEFSRKEIKVEQLEAPVFRTGERRNGTESEIKGLLFLKVGDKIVYLYAMRQWGGKNG